MRRLVFASMMFLVFALPLSAQDDYPKVEVFGGYSYANLDLSGNRDSAHGWHASITGNPHKNFGLEGDVSGHYGSLFGSDYQSYLLMVGPRVAGRFDKVTPWGHTLVGVNHFRPSGLTNENSLAWAVGGGVDINANERVAVRMIQLDYFLVNLDSVALGNDNLHNMRLSFGVVLKW
ncbi:MAG: porin family protein [Acidobacteria bacterium]|nr:porin family protein [Acidobacteriota bacterium]